MCGVGGWGSIFTERANTESLDRKGSYSRWESVVSVWAAELSPENLLEMPILITL